MNNNTGEYIAEDLITDYGNIFEYLPDYITTVSVILDSANFALGDFSIETESVVKKLDKKHFYNDDFFDTNANQVLMGDDILQRFNIKVQRMR